MEEIPQKTDLKRLKVGNQHIQQHKVFVDCLSGNRGPKLPKMRNFAQMDITDQ
jgi:hypothetical protein